jgi:hypothetical protein
VHAGDKVRADPDSLLFLILAQKLGDLACQLLHTPQFVMQDVVHGAIRYPVARSMQVTRRSAFTTMATAAMMSKVLFVFFYTFVATDYWCFRRP